MRFLYFLQFLAITFSFVISLRLVNNKSIPKYMSGFYWYNFLAFLIISFGVLCVFHLRSLISYALVINNFSSIFHVCFLSIFMQKVTPNLTVNQNKWLNVFRVLMVLVILYFLLTKNSFKEINLSFSIVNTVLLVYSIVYFIKIFEGIPNLDLLKTPAFWIITGVFFSSSLLIPVCTAFDLLPLSYFSNTLYLLNIALTLPFILFHCFLIKAFLCSCNTNTA